MKIRASGTVLFHADRQTDGQTWRTQYSLFAPSRMRPKMEIYHYLALTITLSGFEEHLHNAARALTARLLQVL